MAQEWRVCDSLAEDLSLVVSTHVQWLPIVSVGTCTHMLIPKHKHTYTQVNSNKTYIFNLKKIKVEDNLWKTPSVPLVSTCTYTCTYACLHAHTHVNTCTHAYINAHKFTRMHPNTCTHAHTYKTHIYAHASTHMQTHTHMYTHHTHQR